MLIPQGCQSGGVGSGDHEKKCRFWQLEVRRASTEMERARGCVQGSGRFCYTKQSRVGRCSRRGVPKSESVSRISRRQETQMWMYSTVTAFQLLPPVVICRVPNSSTARVGEGVTPFPF